MAIWWRETVAALMYLIGGISARAPFSLAERIVPALILMGILLHRRRAARVLIGLCLVPALLWGSLYFCAPRMPQPPDAQALERLCARMIDRLNERPLVFSGSIGDDPRVKTADFPFWMRMMHISGLFMPLTGEILISPDAAPEALPFTIAHEQMHLRGLAHEGAACIEAWKVCRALGGEAADSADLWALGYGLRMLKRADIEAYTRTEARMRHRLRRAIRFFDVNAAPSDYENLAAYLAANPSDWYN